jgi:protocatechuate 3,4-dioxygenase beta subunit
MDAVFSLDSSSSSAIPLLGGEQPLELPPSLGLSAGGLVRAIPVTILESEDLTVPVDVNIDPITREGRQNPAPVAVASGQNLSGINFGNTQLGSISGIKFNDLNRDSLLTTGEPALAGWTIFIDANNNGTLEATEPSTVTNATGAYAFSNLTPGNYTIREVQQAGWVQTTVNPAPVGVTGGGNIAGINFGNNQSGTITGIKFNDNNGNALFDAGETPLQGWTIFADGNANDILDAGEGVAVTDADGRYTFANLPPASYTIREVQQSGWTQTTPNPGAVGVTGGTNAIINFGNRQFGSISGVKFNDLNSNATFDTGEVGLAGWTIFIDANGNGTLESTEATAVTNATGTYAFANIAPGNYSVREVQQPGWTQTTPNPGPVNLTGGANITGINFGNNQSGTITGLKFNDTNANALLDADEAPLPGWTIFIDANGNGTLEATEAAAVTGADGRYSFANVTVGNYTLREVQQPGWTQTTPNPGPVGITGGTNAVVNFGNRQFGSISGIKFNDTNANSLFDAGETPLQGWTIYIDANGNGVVDPTEPTTVTGADGSYAFTNVPPGNYVLREVQQPGWVQTVPPLAA